MAPSADWLACRTPHRLGQDISESDVPYKFVHVEDIVNSGRVLAFGIELDTLYLPIRINPITYLAALNEREGEVPGYVTDLGSV